MFLRKIKFIGEIIALLVFSLVTLEAFSRVINGNTRSVLPNTTDRYDNPVMLANWQSKVQFSEMPVFEVCTDEFGVRRVACADRSKPIDVLTIGDSQAFGWGMAMTRTFTSIIAQKLSEANNEVPYSPGALAVGGTDIERLSSWSDTLLNRIEHRPKLVILTLNMGNDLDEIYFGRAFSTIINYRHIHQWLVRNSFLMLDYFQLSALLSSEQNLKPPGANPVLFTLSQKELRELSRGIVKKIEQYRTKYQKGSQTQFLVVLLPQDYQVERSQFAKYQPFYSNPKSYSKWYQRAGRAAKRLNTVEHLIELGLQRSHIPYISIRSAIERSGVQPDKIFDRQSHHFNEEGQKFIAAKVLSLVAKQGE